MKISYYSFFYALVLSTVLLSCICFIRKKSYFSSTKEVKTFICLYALCFIRLLLPLDFTFTAGVLCPGLYSIVFDFFIYRKFRIFHYEFSLIMIIFITVLFISVIKIFLYAKGCYKTAPKATTDKPYDPEQLLRVNHKIKKIYPQLPSYPVIENQQISVPLASGILKKRIIMPAIKYSDSELYYILLHEYTHLSENDVLKKYIVDILCTVFWWIPFKKFICKDMEQMLEINCDSAITKQLSKEKKAEYASILLKEAKRASANDVHSYMTNTALSFTFAENPHALIERFRLMAGDSKTNTKHKSKIFIAGGFLLLIFSYLAVPVPCFEPDIEEVEKFGSTAVLPDNSYLYKENDTYFLKTEKFTISVSPEHAHNMMDSGIPLKE